VFGIVNLAAFISAPLYGKFGNQIGAKLVYNTGAMMQALGALLFGFLTFVNNIGAFLGISYLLR